MLRRDPSSVFRSVLLLSAVGTACGGAVETPIGGGPQATNEEAPSTSSTSSSSGGRKSSTSSSSSGGSTTSSSGFTSSSGGSTSSSSSGGSSTSSSGGSTSSSSGGNWTCVNGQIPMEEAFCCAPGASCPIGGGDTVDAGVKCQIDCKAVCAKAAPQVPNGFAEWCYDMGDGNISYNCGACGVGRLPSDAKPCPTGGTIGERLARQAYYEGVSVIAFERLAAVLEASGAPATLVARARSAAKDEARHAAIFGDLARARGAAVPVIEVEACEPTLFDLAIENATEGCVRETLGAAITLHQSMHAESAEVRDAYAAICDDEAEHAAFSWELKGWLDTQLTAYERARVERAHRAAAVAARMDAREAPDALGLALGLPSPDRVRRMLDLALDAMAA